MTRALPLAIVAALAGSALVLAGRTSELADRLPPQQASAAAAPAALRQAATAPAPRRRLVTRRAMESARAFAATRSGTIGFAVRDGRGGVRGWHAGEAFYSASLTKAMLLVARLRQAAGADVDTGALEAMVTASDNDAADTVLGLVGVSGLDEVAAEARMRSFDANGYWANAEVTPADQVRFFSRLGDLVPARHRGLARRLLSSIVPWQRWGIAAAAERHDGARVFFKGGWREGLTHQAALVEWRGRRVAIAVMTAGGPSFGYDVETIEGIAGRLLSRPA